MTSIALSLALAILAQSQSPARGSLCVAPVAQLPPATAATPDLFCDSGKLSLKVDDRTPQPWPRTKGITIDDLDFRARHKIVVQCDGKPQQSFRFTFSELESRDLCLFINDMYQTVQLWPRHRSPKSCRCE
jgi:hypothetical protein